ncbi:MAG: PLP-dependent aspartate aminotransferase family protein [Bacteroidota bacterium]
MDDISHILNQLGEDREHYYNAVSPPVIQTSNFCFPTVQAMRENINREFDIPFYTRGNNPTVAILRKKLAALEGTEDALVTSSGCAAITAAVMSNLKAGDHAICIKNPYSWTDTLFNTILAKYGVRVSMTDGVNPMELGSLICEETKLIYLESPNSFTFELQDLTSVASFAKAKKIITVIDNSYSTPLYQQPLSYGIDIVIHSASKYLGGHSDLVAGVICGKQEMIKKIFDAEFMTFGGIISPHDAWLLMRGLRTLPVRMQKISENAAKVTSFLEQHPMIKKVLYPHLPSHPQYGLAKRQMKGSGGLFSFLLREESTEKIDVFCDSLQRFLLACSWGGYESLVFPASVLYSSGNNNKKNIPVNLIRMYIGLEDAGLLIADISKALEKMKNT